MTRHDPHREAAPTTAEGMVTEHDRLAALLDTTGDEGHFDALAALDDRICQKVPESLSEALAVLRHAQSTEALVSRLGDQDDAPDILGNVISFLESEVT
ncbi:hypothetical protein [Vannielia sp. SX4]|uniref:hypothetical protein n=1 Tax=Vannielia sp. SX4 TaxID=3463852 RepID=UPI004058EED9